LIGDDNRRHPVPRRVSGHLAGKLSLSVRFQKLASCVVALKQNLGKEAPVDVLVEDQLRLGRSFVGLNRIRKAVRNCLTILGVKVGKVC